MKFIDEKTIEPLGETGSVRRIAEMLEYLCHLDTAPRKNLWQEDGSLCLLIGHLPAIIHDCLSSARSG